LSEDKTSTVLLLEAGPDYDDDPNIIEPYQWLFNYFTRQPQYLYTDKTQYNFVTNGDNQYYGGRWIYILF